MPKNSTAPENSVGSIQHRLEQRLTKETKEKLNVNAKPRFDASTAVQRRDNLQHNLSLVVGQAPVLSPGMRQGLGKSKSIPEDSHVSVSSMTVPDFEEITSNGSIIEFLQQEQSCYENGYGLTTNGESNYDCDVDVESIFKEINRLSDSTDTRSVDELLREAEMLLKRQSDEFSLREEKNVQKEFGQGDNNSLNIPFSMNETTRKSCTPTPTPRPSTSLQLSREQCLTPTNRTPSIKSITSTPSTCTPLNPNPGGTQDFKTITDCLIATESILSQESAPFGLNGNTFTSRDRTANDDDNQELEDDGTDTVSRHIYLPISIFFLKLIKIKENKELEKL